MERRVTNDDDDGLCADDRDDAACDTEYEVEESVDCDTVVEGGGHPDADQAFCLDPRYAAVKWTHSMIATVLDVITNNRAVAQGIKQSSRVLKNRAWEEVQEELFRRCHIRVAASKIRGAVHKWRSQYRKWCRARQTMGSHVRIRAPSYINVLHRYLQSQAAAVLWRRASGEKRARPPSDSVVSDDESKSDSGSGYGSSSGGKTKKGNAGGIIAHTAAASSEGTRIAIPDTLASRPATVSSQCESGDVIELVREQRDRMERLIGMQETQLAIQQQQLSMQQQQLGMQLQLLATQQQQIQLLTTLVQGLTNNTQ